MTSQTKAEGEQQPLQTESSNEMAPKFGVLSSALTSQWSQSVEGKETTEAPAVENQESKESTPESEPCDSPRSSLGEDEKVEEQTAEVQETAVVEKTAEVENFKEAAVEDENIE